MAIFVREQIFRDDPVLELRRQPPFAGHHVVAWQVPPEIIVQGLGTTVDLPASENIECLTVHNEDAGRAVGTILAAATKRADINAFRSAMDGVGSRVAGLFKNFLGLNDLVDMCLGGVRLGIHHINPRGPDARNDQVAPLMKACPVSGDKEDEQAFQPKW